MAEIERIRGQIRETARFACHMSDSMARSGALTPNILHEAQTALRQNLLFIERRQRTLESRRKPRAQVLKRRFAHSEFFRDYRAKHIQLLQERDDCLKWQRNLLRQIGDTLAWIVLGGDPGIIGALFALRTHRLPDLAGLVGPLMLATDAHASGTLLVIDNDLTRCLGTGDLTVVSNDDQWVRPLLIEVKSTMTGDGGVDIRTFAPSTNDPSDTRLINLLHAAFGVTGEPTHDISLRHQKQSDDMLRPAQLMHGLLSDSAAASVGGSAVYWRRLETVISRALQTGAAADLVNGVAYLAVRTRSGDDPVKELGRLRARLPEWGIEGAVDSLTSTDFQQRDFLSSLVPPIPLWRLSHGIRSALLAEEVFFATIYRPSLWDDAFSQRGMTRVIDRRNWIITRSGTSLKLRPHDVLRLRAAIGLVGLDPHHVAASLGALFDSMPAVPNG